MFSTFSRPLTLATLTGLAAVGALALWMSGAQATQATETYLATPPALATDKLYQTNRVSAAVPGNISDVRAFIDANPITDFVATTEAIPSIEGITVLSGTWPEVGAVRRVDLEGGHYVLERVLVNKADNFVYQIWNITAPAGRFIDHIKGEFRYIQEGDTTQITWDYNIKPAAFFARPFIRRYLDRDFAPFMQAGMTGLAEAYQTQ